jgi:FkbM family methyltransferase
MCIPISPGSQGDNEQKRSLQGFGMGGLIEPIYYNAARHIYKLLSDKAYRNGAFLKSKLEKMPRYTDARVAFNGWKLVLADAASFLSAYREIFVEQIYAFTFEGNAPRILDLGANIGLSVLYFKMMYPEARVTAFEADPRIFGYLEKNVHGNGYTDVELINKAVWLENTTLEFCSEGADGGRAAMAGDSNLIEVEAIDIVEYLEGKQFDFLKMDIEGAEELVLPACKEHLAHVRYVFVEYHSKVGQKQSLTSIIATLTDAGFRIHVQSIGNNSSPFVEVRESSGFDMQLNIFAWKSQ